jgi:hypothetical protein
MLTNRSIFNALLLAIVASITAAAQTRAPLLDRIVQTVENTDSRWHFMAAFCTCPALVRSQTDDAFGEMYYGKLTDHRNVLIYVSYVPTSVIAAEWMRDLRDRNTTARYQREEYEFADEANLWIYDRGGASLYFRSGATVVWLSGVRKDVQFFARTLNDRWAR